MNNAFRYWQLVRLTNTGQIQVLERSEVQTWLQDKFADRLVDLEAQEIRWQQVLLARWQGPEPDAALAQLSLRCWLTHQIHQVCVGLATRYGQQHGFVAADLFPWVLDDDGQGQPNHQPFTLDILKSYDPTKANLGTWSRRLTRTHPLLNRFLLEKGLYQASDWAILNDTPVARAERILREYHLCSEYEVTQATTLLTQYQQVYRGDRILNRQHQTGRCPEPTPDQLQRINPGLSPSRVKAQLRHLATQLRQYRIHVRSGSPRLYQPHDDTELERLAGTQPSQTLDLENDQSSFLSAYRDSLNQCLGSTIAQVIATNVAKLRDRTPPQDNAYVQGLYLRQCQGLAMGQLATHIGLTSQVQVTRLLNLKRLRADVRHQLLPQLQAIVRREALNYVSADRLKALDQDLESLLAEEVDALMAEAAAEAQSSKRRSTRSRFADRLCTEIHAFLPGQA